MKVKAICTGPNCQDPACDREHVVICVLCDHPVPEQDAEHTKYGPAHTECAERAFPPRVNPFATEGGL